MLEGEQNNSHSREKTDAEHLGSRELRRLSTTFRANLPDSWAQKGS